MHGLRAAGADAIIVQDEATSAYQNRVAAPANSAAHKIQKRPLGFMYNIAGNLFIPARDDVRRQCFRLRHAMIVHLRFRKGAVCG